MVILQESVSVGKFNAFIHFLRYYYVRVWIGLVYDFIMFIKKLVLCDYHDSKHNKCDEYVCHIPRSFNNMMNIDRFFACW